MSEQQQERPGGRPPRGVLWAAAVVVLAVAGIVAGLLASGSSGGSPGASAGSAGTSAPGATSPATSTPASPGSSGQGGSPATSTGSRPAIGTKIYLNGQVTAVSATSITITDIGPGVTAAITGATRFSGQVHSIRDVHVGYQVSAEILEKNGRTTVTTLRYPAAHPGNIP